MRYTDTVKFEHAKIGESCFKLELPRRWVIQPFPLNPLWSRMHEDFSVERFLYPAPPPELGRVLVAVPPELRNVRVLRCPVKKAGDLHLTIPEELEFLRPLLTFCLETELWVNPAFDKFWAHVSFELTEVQEGKTQRTPGWHVDGFQGVRAPRHQIEHSYLWASTAPTQYSLQPYFLAHLDPARHNIFDELERQAKEANSFDTQENHVYLIDPYVVHRAAPMSKSGLRAFFRLTFTPLELEDFNNTVNLGLQCPQAYENRIDVRDRFFGYNGDIPWDYYGVRPLK